MQLSSTPDLRNLIADPRSALKSEAKIHMTVLEVEGPEEAKDVVLTDPHSGSQNPDLSAENEGTANPSFEAGNRGLGR